MPISYDDTGKRDWFSVPQINRARHRYRGPRNTEKINLEIGQLRFSIYKLYRQYDLIWKDFADKANLLLEGGTITGVQTDDATPVDLVIMGLEEITQNIIELEKRIRNLES